jgi:predicted component of type VI protein secretion system
VIRLHILSGKSAGQTYLVRRFPFTVGRTSDSHFTSDDPGVWNEHFRIDYRPPDGLFILPREQAVTMLNSEVLSEPARLDNGSEISAGAMRLRFDLANADVRSYRYRELAIWLAVGSVVLLQVWLLMVLPK